MVVPYVGSEIATKFGYTYPFSNQTMDQRPHPIVAFDFPRVPLSFGRIRSIARLPLFSFVASIGMDHIPYPIRQINQGKYKYTWWFILRTRNAT
ncbi:unnamed protein product [Lactuca virosa]|uniref:Uncharacterized protein n=1 Tax=Lactuca virosa TaxID=75947 RepID=A0AAU9LEN3_9ASTR|nr:unnamed protein product [Lactuca virosa]